MAQLAIIDGVKWHDQYPNMPRDDRVDYVEPLCPKHNLRLGYNGKDLICDEGHHIKIHRSYNEQLHYVVNKLDAKQFAQMPVINIDDEAIPVAKEDLSDTDYWVRAKVTESKSGTRLIVWAGSKKDKNKAQLFVEPELKRMGFDQNDDHPSEVFAKVDATFKDGIKTTIEKEG